MDNGRQMFHCLLIFNNQNEPLLTMYDDYIESLVISPHRSKGDGSEDLNPVSNIIMQIFTPLLASQSALLDTINARFQTVEFYNGKTLVLHRFHGCHTIILLSDQCLFRRQESIIKKKLDLIEWLISSFYGICWTRMIKHQNSWLKVILKEMWLMDENEFNLNFWCIERIDLSSQLKLSEKVLEVLVWNSKYLRQVNEKKMKHQLVLVGSKLFCLYTSDQITNLKPKHTLLFVLICNSIFNRFSRSREALNDEKSKKLSAVETPTNVFSVSEDTQSDYPVERSDLIRIIIKESIKVPSRNTSTIEPPGDLDPFIVWVDNKDGHRYRIVKIFLNYKGSFLTPCYLHLVKLARNVIFVGVEDNLDNSVVVATLDKNIRLLRTVILDNDKRKDVSSVLRLRISQSVDKLVTMRVIHWEKLQQALSLCLSKESKNLDFLERVLKKLLGVFEFIYCQYYLNFPFKPNEKLCKCFLRCFLGVKKEMSDYLSILSVKAQRNLPPTSFYPLYPGLINFVFTIRKVDQVLISPVIDQNILSDDKVAKLHFLADICRVVGTQSDLAAPWRQVEVCDKEFRCTYYKKRCKVSEERYHEFELILFHSSSVSASLVKKQLYLLLDHLLSDGKDNELFNLTS